MTVDDLQVGTQLDRVLDLVVPTAVARAPAGPVIQVFRTPGDLATRWRLISGNGREIGRSSQHFADREAAVEDLRDTTAQLRAASIRIVGDGVRAWRWVLDIDGRVAVEATHAFDRRLRCEQAATLFLQLLPEAEVRTGVLERSARRNRVGRVDAADLADVVAVVTMPYATVVGECV